MEQTRVADIGRLEGCDAELRGWLYNKRSSGKLHFLQLRDGSGVVQCVVFKGDVSPEVFERCSHLTQESSLVICGEVRRDERSPIGYELGVSELEVVQQAEEYPITPKDHGVAFLLNHRHLWLRSSRPGAILKIRSEICKACRDFMDERDFVLVDAPIFTPAACEGTSTLFEIDYFDEKAYLTQSGQLYMEAAAMAFGKAYCFGPTFRAEKSKTRRHLTEFWMIEPELAHCDLAGDMELAEDLVMYVVERVLERRSEELKLLERDTAKLECVQKPFPRITYDQAIEHLGSLDSDIQWGTDLGGEDETVLAAE
ncbi:MAG: amino acid--tRNA ligase-related protein, partial [Candidatus Latescibacterota bacterium]|nr:amino acid--tRNA ligase-related protein [Candidatus Latescibacterota bacterium]